MSTGGIIRSAVCGGLTIFVAGMGAMAHFQPFNVLCFGACCFFTGVTFTGAYFERIAPRPATPAELKDLGVKP